MFNFILGMFFIIFILILMVYIRKYFRKIKIEKYKSKGGNSRESVGENVVAILNGKKISENWIEKFKRKLKGG